MTGNTSPSELLLPALLAMDVYHRDVAGGLRLEVDERDKQGVLDGITPFGNFDKKPELGFFAKAYKDAKTNTIYIVYRGTDDGSLVPGNVFSHYGSETLSTGSPLKDLYYGYPLTVGSLSDMKGTVTAAAGFSNYNSQAMQAVRFYKQVVAAAGNANIVVAGQSLGGGLAC